MHVAQASTLLLLLCLGLCWNTACSSRIKWQASCGYWANSCQAMSVVFQLVYVSWHRVPETQLMQTDGLCVKQSDSAKVLQECPTLLGPVSNMLHELCGVHCMLSLLCTFLYLCLPVKQSVKSSAAGTSAACHATDA
jgi:hypothetical protein